jgi:hypothetical protein
MSISRLAFDDAPWAHTKVEHFFGIFEGPDWERSSSIIYLGALSAQSRPAFCQQIVTNHEALSNGKPDGKIDQEK